ncbi:MAG TPA: hypothetical protein VNU93_09875 [Verrucomicrobiae bacterium]|nr:hypothetical protein [Verrucomicrobiae bacterium]
MESGKVSYRSKVSQANHNHMVRCLANYLQEQGYQVKADHIQWTLGRPEEINNLFPDILARKDGTDLIFEVETCATYRDNRAIDRLNEFAQKHVTYLILPTMSLGDMVFNPVPDAQKFLAEKGQTLVKLGTCNLQTGKITLT